jgi:hypothetical protein
MLVEFLLVGAGVAAGWVLKTLSLSNPPVPEACHAIHRGLQKRCIEPLGHRDPHHCEMMVGAFFEPMASWPTPVTRDVYWDNLNQEIADEACASHADGG